MTMTIEIDISVLEALNEELSDIITKCDDIKTRDRLYIMWIKHTNIVKEYYKAVL